MTPPLKLLINNNISMHKKNKIMRSIPQVLHIETEEGLKPQILWREKRATQEQEMSC